MQVLLKKLLINTPIMNSHDFTEASMSGVFIGISGLIGAGKTTKAEALAKICEEHSLEIVDFFKEPDTPPSRDTLRKIEEIEYLILEETYNKNVSGG